MDEVEQQKLRYDEWKYRHNLVYVLMFRYMASVFAIVVFAVTQANFFCQAQISSIYLGIAALLIGVTGIIHMLVEFVRMVEARLSLTLFDEETQSSLEKRYKTYFLIKTKLPFGWFIWPVLIAFIVSAAYYISVVNDGSCVV